jgi:hypothetical protein
MFTLASFVVCFLTCCSVSLAQTTMCPACNSLQSRWNPIANTGSCLSNVNDPVKYIVGFEQCICSPDSLSNYTTCAKCNNDVGVPIDGLNFGPAASFSSACSRFMADVTSILQPSGLNAFASVVQGAISTTNRASVDLLGYYAFQNVVTDVGTQGGIVTDTSSHSATRFTMSSQTATAPMSGYSGTASDAGRSASMLPITAICVLVMFAISTAIITF